MTDYTELVNALRCKSLSKKCDSCGYGYHLSPDSECNDACHVEQIYADAADAIEALQAEVERLKDSNEELREKQTFIDHYGTEWMTSAKDVPTAAYEHGYADGKAEERAKMQKRNAELHAELERWVSAAEMAGEPKRGEWKATEMYMTDECTACGFLMNWEDVPAWLFDMPHFKDRCPNCGAKMREVQE